MWCKNLKLGDKNTKSKAIHSRTHGSVASMVWVQPRSHETSTCPLNISLPMSGLSISTQEPDSLITTQRISGRKNFKPFFVSLTTSFSNFLSFSSVFLLYDIWATRQLGKQSLCRLDSWSTKQSQKWWAHHKQPVLVAIKVLMLQKVWYNFIVTLS